MKIVSYIIFSCFVSITLYSRAPSVYFMASLSEKDGKVASSLISILPAEQQAGAIRAYEEKFGKYQPPVWGGNVKESAEYKQLQASIQADKTLVEQLKNAPEDKSIKLLGDLLTQPQYSGGKIVETLREKKKGQHRATVTTVAKIISETYADLARD